MYPVSTRSFAPRRPPDLQEKQAFYFISRKILRAVHFEASSRSWKREFFCTPVRCSMPNIWLSSGAATQHGCDYRRFGAGLFRHLHLEARHGS